MVDNVKYYEPYGRLLPKHQKCLLDLWSSLGIPHKEKKQVHGSPLIIIGIDVDPNTTFPARHVDSSKQKLTDELALWSALAKEVTQQISGRNTPACSLQAATLATTARVAQLVV